MPNLLMFVGKNYPLLREKIPEVQDFADPKLATIIQDMRYSILPAQLKAAGAAHVGAAGMAANQWGINKRVFIFAPDGAQEDQKLTVMINPSYVPYYHPDAPPVKLIAGFEGCFSIPLTTGIVLRYDAIVATYYKPNGEKIERVMRAWEARVFQHETDHLNGKLFDGRLDDYEGPICFERICFTDINEMNQFWDDKVRKSREKK